MIGVKSGDHDPPLLPPMAEEEISSELYCRKYKRRPDKFEAPFEFISASIYRKRTIFLVTLNTPPEPDRAAASIR